MIKYRIFLLYAFGIFIGLLITAASSAWFTYNQKTTIADSFLRSVNNELIIGNYRSVSVNLTSAFDAGRFLGVTVKDPSGRIAIDLRDPKASLMSIPRSFDRKVGLSADSKIQNKIVFIYNVAELFPLVAVLWAVLFFVCVPIGILQNRGLERRHAEASRARRLVAVGRLARQVAHDLRSPLSVLQIVSERAGWPDAEISQTFAAATKRINAIADDLLRGQAHERSDVGQSAILNTSSLEQRAHQIPKAEITCDQFGQELRSLISQKNVEFSEIDKKVRLSIFIDPLEGYFVSLDQNEMSRVLSNLINNSFEAIALDGFISVSVTIANHKMEIEIRDNGSGISKSDVGRIFDEGFSTKEDRGHGLGLAHAKSVIENSGGEICLFSEGGNGTLIVLKLPAREHKDSAEDSVAVVMPG